MWVYWETELILVASSLSEQFEMQEVVKSVSV